MADLLSKRQKPSIFGADLLLACVCSPLCYLNGVFFFLCLKMIKTIFVSVLGGLILWSVQNYFKDMPTAKYIISDAIEIPNSNGDLEYAQEVSVVNSGTSAVKTISIKVPRHISTYKLTKHSNQNDEKVFSDANSFELIYPELPSEQKIRMLVRYDGEPIQKDWISISHADGNAQAQENQSPQVNFNWIWLAFVFGMLTQTTGDIRKWKRESFSRWTKDENIFRDDKPWFVSSTEWPEIQFEAIDRSLKSYSYIENSSDIKKNLCYQLLNRTKPEMLPDEKWILLQKEASNLLMAKLSNVITKYTKVVKLVDFFKIEKPKALSNELWSDIEESLTESLINNLLPTYIKDKEFVAILDTSNPILKHIPETVAVRIRELAQERYTDYLTNHNTLRLLDNPLTILKTARLDLLTNKQSDDIKESVFRFSRVNGMPSIWDICELKLFISKGKPEWMSEKEFNSLSDFVTQSQSLADQRDSLNRQQYDLESNKLATDKLKARVLSQLELIDKILINPSAIEKIEDYDQTFAPGNRKNLELIASLLKSAPINTVL
ncbi:hypothetical protein [Nitrosomonas nitrosa]|uniref:hypothetical protein n=1 Tax=Nitrosomonas nitrosa TaxID=52442 RepID=UPI0011B260A5|nr:hypothetical protein [Nitrosomonas nitrosa]